MNKQLSVLGFSLHEYAILRCLSEQEEAPQSQLARDAAIDYAAVSRLVRQLTQARVVSTRIDPNDKRQRLAKLTSKGQTLLRSLSPVVDNMLKPYLSGLTSAEEAELLRLLRKAREGAGQAAREGGDAGDPDPKRARSARPHRVLERGAARTTSGSGWTAPEPPDLSTASGQRDAPLGAASFGSGSA